ncbi:MAG: hypothetical protein WCA09_05065 [Burkholderiales bacterium]
MAFLQSFSGMPVDLSLLLLTAALFGLTVGLGLLCARLMEKK